MDAATRAVLNDTENLLIEETSRETLKELDEDGAIELENRIRRARQKYLSQYRRGAAAAVAEHGGRGKARPENASALRKAEAFERALARVSRRVAVLAGQAAAELRAERLAMARDAKQQGDWPGAEEIVPRQARSGPEPPARRTGERALRNPQSERDRAQQLAQGARNQAKRDSKRAAARHSE